jgi:hypothetical protein
MPRIAAVFAIGVLLLEAEDKIPGFKSAPRRFPGVLFTGSHYISSEINNEEFMTRED